MSRSFHKNTEILPKRLFHFIEKRFAVFIGLWHKIGTVAQLLEHCALFAAHALRRPYVHVYQLVAFFVALHTRKPLALEPEYFTALGAGGYLYFGAAINGRHLYFGAKHGVAKADVQIESYV